MKKRDRLLIIRDILKIMERKSKRPTHVMYQANLSHQMLTEYTEELLKKRFIAEKSDGKGKKLYSITDKGRNFLQDYKVIRGFVDSYGLE